MFKKHSSIIAADMICESSKQLGEDVAKAAKELSERMCDISQAEIKARDRVDIALEEYLTMRKYIESLESENRGLKLVISKIDIPINARLIPDTIETKHCHDHRDFRTHWCITFDTEE